MSEQQVRETVVAARKAKAELLAVIAGIDAKVSARRDDLAKNLSELPTAARLAAVDAAASTLKSTLKNETNPKRTELLRRIARLADDARRARSLYDNPVTMLMRATLASDKRRVIFDNMEASGKTELGMIAGLAVASKDLDMAAAVCARLYQVKPATGRPTSPRAVADALLGELQREMLGALLEVDSILTEAALANRLMESGRSTGIGNVELALKKRREAEVGGARVEYEADAE
jgi:hypothetical protein